MANLDPAEPTPLSRTHSHSVRTNTEMEFIETCRICRGEGTTEEPLFYPCKCSGSIKFVHQDCLMEWLSHSQKKYCELCKTPFRFTKLYHPQMPSYLPTTIFFRRALVHIIRHFITWCRGFLVGSVWLFMLPYCMRVIWWALFWLGDGSWSRESSPRMRNSTEPQLHASAPSNSVIPSPAESNPFNLENRTNDAANSFHKIWSPISHTLNMSADPPTVFHLIGKFLFNRDVFKYYSRNITLSNSTALDRSAAEPALHKQSSILSEIEFFKTLSDSPSLNRVVLDVIEGQIITLVVVVAFILIFLIREWVVQQQPVINLAALDAGNRDGGAANRNGGREQNDRNEDAAVWDEMQQEDNSPHGLNLEDTERLLAERGESLHGAIPDEKSSDNDQDSPSRSEDEELEPTTPGESSLRAHEGLASERDISYDDSGGDLESNVPSYSGRSQSELKNMSANNTLVPRDNGGGPSEQHLNAQHIRTASVPIRPGIPERGRSSLAAEIRRTLEEGQGSLSSTYVSRDVSDHSNRDSSDLLEDNGGQDGTQADVFENFAGSNSIQHTSNPKGKGKVEDNDDDGSREEMVETDLHSFEIIDDFTADRDEAPRPAAFDFEEQNSAVDIASSLESPSGRESEDIAEDQGEGTRRLSSTSHGLQQRATEEHVNSSPTRDDNVRYEDAQQATLLNRVTNWLWGDIAPAENADIADGENDEQVVEDIANEPPFVPFPQNQLDDRVQEHEPLPNIEPEAPVVDAEQAIDINDQDAAEDAEDLEGILELIGMQGPMGALFQNALFSALLITATLTCAVWLPYLWGKVVLLFVGSPLKIFVTVPLWTLSASLDLVIDIILYISGILVFNVVKATSLLAMPLNRTSAGSPVQGFLENLGRPVQKIASEAFERIGSFYSEFAAADPSHFQLSVSSHAALRLTQLRISHCTEGLRNILFLSVRILRKLTESGSSMQMISDIPPLLAQLGANLTNRTSEMAAFLWNIRSFRITFDVEAPVPNRDNVLQWSATDRFFAIIAGYAFFAVLGALYLKRGIPFSSSPHGRKIEGVVSELLQQAGGVFKVILIISIEMIAFPLYCGILLDLALLPLFSKATVYSRWQFTNQSPWTSGFVHWFIGTCYMFHFALFVSMCRKIMRKGVLYFIRDPDDPTFHPVRDVLERNVTTQLRKIAFSGMVYGCLIIFCLGGVVWTIDWAFDSIFPIQWATNQPSLEFPLDLLFYNFLTPLVVRYLRPANGLEAIYKWWFKKCARALRLTDFLFGNGPVDEQGRHVRRTWSAWLKRENGDYKKPIVGLDVTHGADEKLPDCYFQWDGKFVRAPASDQVRIPKNEPVFVEVDQHDARTDGKPEDEGIHAKSAGSTAKVYIPPWFRVRIALFVSMLWLFAAFTGTASTVIPLIFGRKVISSITPNDVHMNDIYALSLGMYSFGGFFYLLLHCKKGLDYLKESSSQTLTTTVDRLARTLGRAITRVMSVIYVYTTLVILLPVLFALLLELYILIPLHTYIGPKDTHVIHIVQDWTLGFLYARIAYRLLFWNTNSRPAMAVQAVVRDGYWRPNARLATRYFIVPTAAFFLVALILPWLLANLAYVLFVKESDDDARNSIFRFAYPVVLACVVVIVGVGGILNFMRKWRRAIKDEVYLVGERLHNFGEKKSEPNRIPSEATVD